MNMITKQESYNAWFEKGKEEGKKEVLNDPLIIIQFGCLESWCASRYNHIGDYCDNCRRLNEIKIKHLNTDNIDKTKEEN